MLVSRWTTADGVFHLYGGYTPNPLRVATWSLGFESMPIVKRFIPKIYSYNPEFYAREGYMEWCPPCFMLLKRDVYQKTGGFDEKLFFHMVDVEWCHRMKKEGFVIGFTPSVQVVHLGGASSKDMDQSLIKDNFRAMIHFLRKHYPHNSTSALSYLRLGLSVRSILFSVLGKQTLAATYREMAHEVSA